MLNEHQAMASFPLLLKHMGVFIFDHLCTNHYRASLAIFFSPLNAWFLL
jgi:hypothetical protein